MRVSLSLAIAVNIRVQVSALDSRLDNVTLLSRSLFSGERESLLFACVHRHRLWMEPCE